MFNHLYVSMIRAGEVGGALDETLNRLADTLESAVRLRSKVKSAMAYPVVVLSLIVLIVSGMLLFVVPIFKKMYDDLGGTLPFPTRMLINISNLITTFWWIVLAMIIGGVIGFRRWKKTPEGRRTWDRLKLRRPNSRQCRAEGGDLPVRPHSLGTEPNRSTRAAGTRHRLCHRRQQPRQ